MCCFTKSLEGPGEPDGRRAEPELEHGVQDGLELLDLDREVILWTLQCRVENVHVHFGGTATELMSCKSDEMINLP